jgi:hypothetical protein
MLRAMRIGGMTVLLLAALAGGCTSYSAPTLEVAQARVKEESRSGLVIDFAIDATNRNDVELPLKEVRYTLRLDGREVFSGVRSPEASLRRLGTQRFHIPAAVALDGAAPGGRAHYALEGELLYVTPGQLAQVLFDIKVRRPRVGFGAEGDVSLTPEPEALPPAGAPPPPEPPGITPAPAGSGPPG